MSWMGSPRAHREVAKEVCPQTSPAGGVSGGRVLAGSRYERSLYAPRNLGRFPQRHAGLCSESGRLACCQRIRRRLVASERELGHVQRLRALRSWGEGSRRAAVRTILPPQVAMPPPLFQAPLMMSLRTSWGMRVSALSQNPLM